MRNFVVAITGASGSIYGVRLVEVLLRTGNRVHLTISPSATRVFEAELGVGIRLDSFDYRDLLSCGGIPGWNARPGRLEDDAPPGNLTYHDYRDYRAGIASGSFPTSGMVICPCSMGTLGSIASGLSTNLIHRAADVHLKERRKLVVVPRETPLGSLALSNMKTISDAGAVVLPAMPGFYHQPQSMMDLVDFIVARICDQLGVEVALMLRWGESES